MEFTSAGSQTSSVQVGRQKACFPAVYRHLLKRARDCRPTILDGLASATSREAVQGRAQIGGAGRQERPPGEKVVACGTAMSR